MKAVIKTFPRQKSPGQDGFTGKFYQMFIGELTPIILKLSPKIEKKASITLIPKPDKDTKKLQFNIPDEY